MGTEEGEFCAKGLLNIFNKIIESILSLKKEMSSQVEEAHRTLHTQDEKRNSPCGFIVKH